MRSFLDNLAILFVSKLMRLGYEVYLSKLQKKLHSEEVELSARLSKMLGIPEGYAYVRLKGFMDGSVLIALELKTELSANKLAQAQRFVDSLGPIRQNVLIHKASKH